MSEHVCPDGHEVAALVALRCQHDGCQCEVAYQPVSVGMRLHEQLERITHLEAQACANLDAEQAKADALREAVRGFLNGAPLDEHGRFKDARLEALYRAAGGQ